jgi:hypothetical protein
LLKRPEVASDDQLKDMLHEKQNELTEFQATLASGEGALYEEQRQIIAIRGMATKLMKHMSNRLIDLNQPQILAADFDFFRTIQAGIKNL